MNGGGYPSARSVENGLCLHPPDRGHGSDAAARDADAAGQELTGVEVQHTAATDDEVGGPVADGYRMDGSEFLGRRQ